MMSMPIIYGFNLLSETLWTQSQALSMLCDAIKNTYSDMDVYITQKDSDKIHIHNDCFLLKKLHPDVTPIDVIVIEYPIVCRDLDAIYITAHPARATNPAIGFMVTLDFHQRPTCTLHKNTYELSSLLGFGDVLQIVQDALSLKPNQLIDSTTRVRLDDFFPLCKVVSMHNFPHEILQHRDVAYNKFDLTIQHVSKCFLADASSVIIEQHILKTAHIVAKTLEQDKMFRVGISKKMQKENKLAHQYDSYIDESDVFNLIHILEQLYMESI